MKKKIKNSKWSVEVKNLLTSLEQEINAATKNNSIAEVAQYINNKQEFFEQLKEIDALLVAWLKDLVYSESFYNNFGE